MSQENKGKVDDFIDRSFRDVADADYLAARICWKRELDHQFWWMALQAVEKYLKGILLFSRKSVHDLNHNLIKALERVKEIESINFKPKTREEQFIKALNNQGPNRYFEWNLQRNGDELLLLDECIWNLRIRCVPLNSDAKHGDQLIWTSQEHFEKIRSYQSNQNPSHIWIPFGKLEKILEGKSEIRKELIWKNFFFGCNRKRLIKWKQQYHFSSPNHVSYPDIFPELDKLVRFSKQVREHFGRT